MLIDSHCHLDFPELSDDLTGVIDRAAAAGVGQMITISTRVSAFDRIVAVAERFPNVFCSVGTHPHQAHEEPDTSVARLVELSRHPKCVAIGEAGLDYHYDRSPRDIAARVFKTHIGAARESGLPLIIHARDADGDVAAILEEEMGKGRFAAVLHCFTSSRRLAQVGLELGLFVSFSGVLTFKGSNELRAIARDIPLERLLVETDAPFLAPVPHRGKRNEPAFVRATARVLSETKEVSETTLEEITTENVYRLFSKMTRVRAPESADSRE